MAFPLLPLLAVAAVAAVAVASKGGGSSGEGEVGPEPQHAGVIPLANLERDVPIWKASGYAARAQELSVELANPHDVTVLIAKEVFPRLYMPPGTTGPQVNKDLWRIMRDDVWEALNPGVPYPVD